MSGFELGMRLETRQGMQARYKRERTVTCPSCGDPDAKRYPNGRIACERDCDDND